MIKKIIAIIFIYSFTIFAQISNQAPRQSGIIQSNAVTCEIWNYGSFSAPSNKITDFVWKGLGYGYEYGVFIGAEVEVPKNSHPDVTFMSDDSGNVVLNPQGDTIWVAHVISDGLVSMGGEYFGNKRWGFNPIINSRDNQRVYMDPASDHISSSDDRDRDGDGKPDSWPADWWNVDSSDYIWPGFWYEGNIIGDMEALYGMDDRDNEEFEYFPFVSDSALKGLGIEIETRIFQVQDFYEDMVFVSYILRNVSDKDLDKLVFGIWGDPHIGGWSDYQDDMHSYDLARNLIYAWDYDGYSNLNPNIIPGYFGTVFLQTAGIDSDNVDNDNDGLTDESQINGIDDDGDWDIAIDDIGSDGIANTNDSGEGDGVPTVGEPNFEHKDCDEVDQLGITSLQNPQFSSTNRISNDEKVWSQFVLPGLFDSSSTPGDYIFVGGSGYFSLPQQNETRISLAFIFADDLDALLLKADKAQQYYNRMIGSQSSNMQLSITSPQPADRFETQFPVQWNSSSLLPNSELELAYSIDNSHYWHKTIDAIPNSGSQMLGIDILPNSAFYKLRMRAISNSGYGQNVTSGFFTIDHSGPVNVAPEILFELDDGLTISEVFELNWMVADVDSDQVQVSLIIESPLTVDTVFNLIDHYSLNTLHYPNNQYQLTVSAFDGVERTEVSHTIYFSNNYHQVNDTLITHNSGIATGTVWANVHDFSNVTNHQYEVSFKDSIEKTYSVKDLTTGEYKLVNQALQRYPSFGNQFDGVELSFTEDAFAINPSLTAWSASSLTDLQFTILREYSYAEDPYDYEIIFYNDFVDTTITNVRIPFRVKDIINNQYMEIATTVFNTNWGPGDTFFILRGGLTPDNIVWQIHSFYPDTNNTNPPGEGDVFYLKTFKPFTSDDKYILDMLPLSGIGIGKIGMPNSFALFQNYPNPFNSTTNIKFNIPNPSKVKLTIYDIIGRRVKVLTDSKFSAGRYKIPWAGKNTNGEQVASGVYFYRLEIFANSKIIKTKKMLLVK